MRRSCSGFTAALRSSALAISARNNRTSNAKSGVVTVSINYRLGALANFSHAALS